MGYIFEEKFQNCIASLKFEIVDELAKRQTEVVEHAFVMLILTDRSHRLIRTEKCLQFVGI